MCRNAEGVLMPPSRKKEIMKVIPSPSWTLDMGVSFSLLNRFIACRDRFQMYAVQGMREPSNSQDAMNFGTYFHRLLEFHAKDQRCSADTVIRKVSKLKSSVAIKPVEKMMANMIFREYLNWYGNNVYSYFDQEVKFDLKYPVPGAGNIRIRGKVDECINHSDGTIWVQENKTKDKIQDRLLEQVIPFQLQTLMYAVAMEKHFKRRVGGVVYNVIRKPSHKQKDKESDEQFVGRVREILLKEPGYFFYRWEYPLTRERLDDFRKKTFEPLLRQIYVWWESIKHDPFSPWVDQNGLPNENHFQHPFGCYNGLIHGEGDFYDLIVRGNQLGISLGNEPFSELREE